MSPIDNFVVLVGLCVGYWAISKLFTYGRKVRPDPEQEPKTKGAKDDEATWHEILNVSPYATVDEIRQSYKMLMGQYHPDKVAALGDELKARAERKSKAITSAYREAVQLRGVHS